MLVKVESSVSKIAVKSLDEENCLGIASGNVLYRV
jgi:hypothetical protein